MKQSNNSGQSQVMTGHKEDKNKSQNSPSKEISHVSKNEGENKFPVHKNLYDT